MLYSIKKLKNSLKIKNRKDFIFKLKAIKYY